MRAILLLMLLAPAACAMGGLRLLIVDPAHSETGAWCAAVARQVPQASVSSIDLSQAPQAAAQEWDAAVWVAPEAALYSGEAQALWRRLSGERKTGFLVFGLPRDEEGRQAVFKALQRRGQVAAGPHIGDQFDRCSWIWADEAKLDSTVRFRGSFELKAALPKNARAWLQLTADNQARVFLNGEEIGTTADWKTPLTEDVTARMKAGRNVLAVECHNEDGPAGVLASLCAFDNAGTLLAATRSGLSWKQSETAPRGWASTEFDDSGWAAATEVAPAGSGPWARNVQIDDRPRQWLIEPADSSHPSLAGISSALGKASVIDGLTATGTPRARAILRAGGIPVGVAGEGDGGRGIIISAEPERVPLTDPEPDLLRNNAFASFFARSMVWLAGSDATAQLSATTPADGVEDSAAKPILREGELFPIVIALTPLPREGVRPWAAGYPRSPVVLRGMVDEIISHGCTSLLLPSQLPAESAKVVADHAQARGMTITFQSNGAELFARAAPPAISVYSPQYPGAVRQRLKQVFETFSQYPRLRSAFIYEDEPFHQGPGSFGYDQDTRDEFQRRYGYPLPADLESARSDPKVWLDVLDFRADNFADGFRQVYRIAKELRPDLDVLFTHDSHNTFGGGAGQESQLAVDDVYRWGADFADTLVFDIYPYMSLDYRYGPNRAMMQPRMSQAHFAFAQLRNVARSGGKRMGYWFDSYNAQWFELTPARLAQYWLEREMVFTGIANGADLLLAAAGVPEDRRHWEDLGSGLNVIQKAGAKLAAAPRLPARAAFVFPRAQYLQTQTEYWNVAQSFEVFLRALGELDVIHEDQLAKGGVPDQCKMLILCDVEMLSAEAASRIDQFVNRGGTLVADCVPTMDEQKRPMDVLTKLFGVSRPQSGRIIWPVDGSADSVKATGSRVQGEALGLRVDLPIISPRSCAASVGKVLLKTTEGTPALVTNRPEVGWARAGRTYLLGFCMQDTVFRTYQSEDPRARDQLYGLVRAIARDAGVITHVYSSNPEVEAAVRANGKHAFLLVISHEPAEPATRVSLNDLPLRVEEAVDLASGREIPMRRQGDTIELELAAPKGTTLLIQLLPQLSAQPRG